MEVWKEIPGYERCYEVSSEGRIRNMERRVICKGNTTRLIASKVKKLFVSRTGYLITTLSKENKLMTYTVHQLVALAFIPGFTKGTHLNHLDGNKTNNNVLNLEVSNPSHNGLHAYRLGLSPKVGKSMYHHVSYINNPAAIAKWAVSIRHNGKSSYGWKTFKTELEAAVYADELLDSIGDTQRLRNFPIP